MKRRVRRMRRMHSLPAVKGFSPFGSVQNLEDKTVYLLLEEYESIRLCDYDMITHQEASVIMGISRPTFTRIYASARQKVAKAFVEGLKMYSISNVDSAIYHFEKSLKYKPNSAESHYYIGVMLSNRNDYYQAVEYLTKAIEIKPDYADAYFSRAMIYNYLGNKTKMCKDLRAAQQYGKMHIEDKLKECIYY